jgi:predicted MFS family arabinose efflux permease
MFTVGADLFVVSPLLPLIAGDYAVPPASAGYCVTIFAAAYMLSAPALGHLADRIGRQRVLVWSLWAFVAANLLTAAAGDFTWLLSARCFAGAAAAGVSPSVYALASASAPAEQRATWLAIVVSGLLMSLSFGAPVGLLTAGLFGWQIVFAGLSVLTLLLVWANSRVWHDRRVAGSRAAPTARLPGAAVIAGLAPTVLWSTALYAVYTYFGEGLGAAGFSTEEIARLILFYGCGAIAGTLIGGRMADRLGAQMASSIGLVGLCLGLLVVLIVLVLDPGILVDCAFGLVSLLAQLFFPAQQLRLASEFPANRAALLAWNNSALFLGISLGSLIGGQAVSFGGFRFDLAVAATIALVGVLVNQGGGRRPFHSGFSPSHRPFQARVS